MISLFKRIALVISCLIYTCDALNCNFQANEEVLSAGGQDCSVSRDEQTFENKCQVTISDTGGTKVAVRGCVPAGGSVVCGQRYSVVGVTTKICCCDSAKCNDDAFEKQCWNGATTGNDKRDINYHIGIGNGAASITGSIMLVALVFAMALSI